MRLTINGRRRDFGLGPIHKVSLHDAREMAVDYRAKAYQGIDPIAEKRQRRNQAHKLRRKIITFEQAARTVHAQRRGIWSNGKHVDQWINTLRDYAFPIIGAKAIDEIDTPDVLEILTPIWTAKPETARRVKQRISTVLNWARIAGHRSGLNPVDGIDEALPRVKRDQQHHPALPFCEVSQFVAKLRAGPAEPITKLAFEFLILTAARTVEVRFARWDEINVQTKTWTIPGHDPRTGRRMKGGQQHVVPLSERCLEILQLAKQIVSNRELIFPDTTTGRAMSENRFLVARDSLGYSSDKCTPHGFRSSFRDWVSEETNFPSEVAEMALAHTIKSKVEAAYRRGQLLAKRTQLMDEWARYIEPRRVHG